MLKHLLMLLSLLFSINIFSQNVLIFKKNKQTIQNYWKGNKIAFMLQNKQWQMGEITNITSDSFTVLPTAILFTETGVDTMRFFSMTYGINEIYAVPKEGVVIDYQKGYFDIAPNGEQDFLSIVTRGDIFIIGGLGYILLNRINNNSKGLSDEDSKKNLITAACVAAFGGLLKISNKCYIKMNKKYHFEVLNLGSIK